MNAERYKLNNTDATILKLNKAGSPIEWISAQDAVTEKSSGKILWEMGKQAAQLRGGIQNDGQQSICAVPAIIAVKGRVVDQMVPSMSNQILFARDGFMCLYCGQQFPGSALSRDHVLPTSRGGEDTWTNAVTACKPCNGFKGSHLPQEIGWELMAVPFAPNLFEYFYLNNRNVLADQMEYLQTRFKNVVAA